MERGGCSSGREFFHQVVNGGDWQNLKLRMQQELAADPKSSASWYDRAKRYLGGGLFANYWEIKLHDVEGVMDDIWDEINLSTPGYKIKIIGALIFEYLERYEASTLSDGVIPCELDTPEAWALWRKLQAKGMVDAHLQLKLAQGRGAIIADVMGDMLRLYPKWNAFEALWHINNLANKRSQVSSKCKYYDDFRDEVVRILR